MNNRTQKKINNKIKELSHKYNRTTALRAIVASIPYIGGALDIIFSGDGAKRTQERISKLIEEIQEEISLINENNIDKEFFNSDEGYDIIVKTFNATSKTRQEEKIKIFAKIITSSVDITKSIEEGDSEIFISIVDSLREIDIEVAKQIYGLEQSNEVNEKGFYTVVKNDEIMKTSHILKEYFPDLDEDDLDYILSKLEKEGLIKEMGGSYFGYMGGVYKSSKILGKFFDFVLNLTD